MLYIVGMISTKRLSIKVVMDVIQDSPNVKYNIGLKELKKSFT